MDKENLYEVEFISGNLFGPFVISGENPEQLRIEVESRLTHDERLGQPYDMSSLAINIYGVNEDAAIGRIARPDSVEEYTAAVVEEYKANLALTPKSLLQQLQAYLADA